MDSNITEGGIHRLFIANPTRQTQVICYRLDHNRKGEPMDANRRFTPHRQQKIEPGRQERIGSDWHMTQIEEIIDQLARYGLVAELDVKNGRLARRVHPYVYNIDKPVSTSAMLAAKNHNEGILIEQGRDRRKKGAVASNEMVQKAIESQYVEAGIPAEPAPSAMDVTFEQQESMIGDDGQAATSKPVEEGYHLRSDGAASAPAPKRRGRPPKPR